MSVMNKLNTTDQLPKIYSRKYMYNTTSWWHI